MEKKTETTVKYKISGLFCRLFFFFRLYSMDADYDTFRRSYQLKVGVETEVFPSREDFKDPQLKILTDVILAIDDMISEEGANQKSVLVVGSSSEDGVSSGLAYGVIPHMLDNYKVDLWDPYNNEGKITHENGQLNFHKGCYTLREDDKNRYDIYLDDAWEPKIARSWDPNDLFTTFKYYSVKWFKEMKKPIEFGKNFYEYFQAFKTDQNEYRLVSRRIDRINYEYAPFLGSCPGCRELKFMLKNRYPDSFYKYYMECHKVNCIDKTIKRVPLIGKDEKHKEQVWYECSGSLKGFSYLYYDKFTGGTLIPINQVFKGDKICFTDFGMVLQSYYDECLVVVVDGYGDYYINEFDNKSFTYLGFKVKVTGNQVIYPKINKGKKGTKFKEKRDDIKISPKMIWRIKEK